MTPAAEQAVTRYLDDLGRMLSPAPPAQRAEVLGQIRDHLDDALAELGPAPTEQQVHALLTELGPAADIAAAALPDTVPSRPLTARPWLPWLVVALVGLGVVPVLGLVAAVAGLVLFGRSPLWDRGWKIGGAIGYGVVLAIAAVVVTVATVSTPTGPVGGGPSPLAPTAWDTAVAMALAVPIAWTVVAVVLALRATVRPVPSVGVAQP
jgi:hypothetical protein